VTTTETTGLERLLPTLFGKKKALPPDSTAKR